MSRRHSAPTRTVPPDALYKDERVAKLINVLMLKGKKSVAEKIVYEAFEMIKHSSKKDVLEVFHQALGFIKPSVEVRSRRVGGATYQIPMDVRPQRSETLALRWLVNMSLKRGEKRQSERLAGEILEAYAERGGAVKKRVETHKMAEANKAFAHYRW